jgi:transcriptional regulator with XRE-family HTH domain
MLTIDDRSPDEIAMDVARRARRARLDEDLTQSGLAERAGVSLGSLRRFERTGQISLQSLVKLAFALDATDNIDALFAPAEIRSLDQIMGEPMRRRGHRS